MNDQFILINSNTSQLTYTLSVTKGASLLLPLTSPHVNRFSKFFCWRLQ